MSTPQLQSTKPSAALVSAFLDQLTPFMTSILTNNQLNDFLSPQNVNPFLKSSFTVVDNLQFLGSKLLKSAASSFAYSSFPTADTEKLTAVVANLVSGESLAPFIATIRVDKESSFHVLLGYCCRVLGVEVTANAILGDYFASALALTKNALDIPQILNALRPGAHLQGLSREQRIDLVRQELRSRFIYVSEPQQMDAGDDDDADGDDSSPLSFSRAASSAFGADGGIPPTPHHQPPTCFRVTVSRGTLDKQTVHFYSEVEAKEYVLVVARQFIKEMKDAKKSGGGGVAEGDDAEDGGAPKATTPKLTLDEVDPAQATAFGLFLMHTCKRILRFESPYDDKLETMGRLAHCIESGGWIPITDVQTLLIEHLAVTCSNIEQPQLDFICRMLEEHDGLQRFEIGLCSLSSSPFYGVRCARALYAHHGAVACATIPLYRSILDSFERPGGCPSTGWMLFDSKQIKNFKTRGLRLFDNNLLLTIVSQDAIVSTFVPYLERGEMHSSVPYLQRCMLDEKVRAPMFFVEVYIGAAFHDSHMTVKQHPDRGDTPGHYILMPTGHRYRKKAKGSEAKYFPLRFLSGRTLELKYASPPGAAATAAADGGGPRGVQLVTGTIALPVDPVVQFDETELAELLRLGGGTAAEPVVESEPSLDPSAEDALPTPEIVRLDDAPLREKVEAFHRDENIVMMELEIPRCSRVGGSLFERSKTVGELKAWIMTLGLEYRELPRRSGCDVLLLRKHQAFPEYVLDEIIGELSLESLGRRDLLRKAITRECINSSENYERLEFIGDAVLDLVVALDATIVYGGCLTAGDCNAVQKLRSSGTLPVSSATQHAPPVCNGVARSVVQVAVDVCRNEVLSELLPRVLHAHMGTLYGDDVPMKVKADMFEAIVGAVYDSELGLDMVRRVVADLYHQNLHDAMKRKEGNPEALWKCRLAMQLCPYVNAEAIALLGTIQPLNCTVIMVGKNQEELASPDDSGFPGGDFGSFGSGNKRKTNTLSSRKFTTANSHLASTGFPRIQDKDYATHFTTGTVYSYRRLGEHDIPSMQNRMLQLFHEGSIGFVNETLGDVTRLTFDIDGINMKSYGLVHILREWIRATWGVQNSPSALILNCSGKSVVSKKQKFSCHVHIPDQVLTIDALTKRTSSLRSYIVDFFAKNVREGCLGTGSLVTGRVASGSSLNNPVHHQPATTTIIGRVVLDMQLMIKRFNSVMEYESHVEWTSAAVDADGYRSLPEGWTSPARKATLLLSFLGLKDLLLAMTVSKTFYRAGVLLLTDDIDANPSAWARRYLVPMQQEAANVAKNPLPSIIGHRNINLRSAQVVHVLNTDHTWSGRFVLCDCIHGGFSYIRAAQDVEPFVDEHSAGKPKRFFELLQPHLDKSIFDASFWEKTVDHGLVESKKLRMYLNDKFDTVYGQEFRPLLFDSIVDPVGAGEAPSCYKPSISSAIGVVDERSDACQGPATRASEPLHVNHRALLEAATLRSATVWDAYGGANELWDTDLFSSLPCLDVANILDAVAPDLPAYHEDVSVTPNSIPSTVSSPKYKRQNRLPSFEDIRTAPAGVVSCNDWQLWCSGVFSITEVKEESWGNIGGSKIQRHAALFPASWRYCDATRTASFQVLGETLFSICGIADLSTAIGDYGGKGMAMLSRILTPHVNVDAPWRTPSNQFRSWLELWEESGRGGLGGTGQSIAAHQQNQQRGRASGNNGGPEAVVVNGVTLKTVGSSAPSAAPATTQSVRGTPAASSAPPSTAVAKSGPTSPSSPHSFEESAQYFRMKFDRIDFQPMADMQGCAPDGSFQHVEWMLQQHSAISDVCIATAIRRWTKGWQGLVDGRGALVATRSPLLGVLFLDVASDSFAPYLTVQVLDLIKPSKRATTELRAALAVSETPFTAIIYAERTIETSTFYWLLERLQPHGTCWFVFREAFEESQKLRGSSCFHGN